MVVSRQLTDRPSLMQLMVLNDTEKFEETLRVVAEAPVSACRWTRDAQVRWVECSSVCFAKQNELWKRSVCMHKKCFHDLSDSELALLLVGQAKGTVKNVPDIPEVTDVVGDRFQIKPIYGWLARSSMSLIKIGTQPDDAMCCIVNTTLTSHACTRAIFSRACGSRVRRESSAMDCSISARVILNSYRAPRLPHPYCVLLIGHHLPLHCLADCPIPSHM